MNHRQDKEEYTFINLIVDIVIVFAIAAISLSVMI